MTTIEAEPGETMYFVSVRACEHAAYTKSECRMKHNDSTVRVFPESFPADIYEKLHMQQVIDRYERI
jgi:hypothetical protein